MKLSSVCRRISVLVMTLSLLPAAQGVGTEPEKTVAHAPSSASVAKVAVPPEFEKDFAAAVQIDDAAKRAKALCLIGKAWSKKDPIAALGWSDYLMAEGTLLPHIKNMEYQWGVTCSVLYDCGSDPVRAKLMADYILSQKDVVSNLPTGYFFRPTTKLIKLNSLWVVSDPVACTAFCMKAPPSLRYAAFMSAGSKWAQSNPSAALAWTLKLESDKDRYSAIMGVGNGLSVKNIDMATEWIKKLKPEEARNATKLVFQNYRRKDAAAAKEWVEKLGLSKEDTEYVLNGPWLNSAESNIYTKEEGQATTNK